MNLLKKNRVTVLIILFILVGGFFRLFNLNWGAPYYFHPDERNIVYSVTQLSFPENMNPHFFAYGSLPIYAIYFTGVISNSIQYAITGVEQPVTMVPFEKAIIISRFFSSFFSLLLIPILFVLAKRLKDEKTGIIAAFLAVTSVGFIQFAHFGTFEMWLTIFGTLLFWLCLKKITENIAFLLGLVFGVLIATKISSLALLPLPLLAILLNSNTLHSNQHVSLKKYLESFSKPNHIVNVSKNLLLFLLISASVYVITNPYVFRDTKSFQSSMNYETSLALGSLPVFYTGEFYNTIPGVFQFLYIYPFLLNPLLTLLFIPAFVFITYKGITKKNGSLLLLVFFFLILFLSQIFLFVKWTRYMVPTLPFIYVILAVALTEIFKHYSSSEHSESRSNKRSRQARTITTLAISCLVVTCFIFSLSYFITAFVRPDTRIEAKNFAVSAIPSNAQILSEVYDLGIVPFNGDFQKIDLFNFYTLDPDNPLLSSELQTKVQNSDFIILPSQRLYKIRLNNPEKFPNGSSFYNSLRTGTLEYEEIYKTSCDIFCKITYLGDPVFRYEETANVFDRPTVFIFRKK